MLGNKVSSRISSADGCSVSEFCGRVIMSVPLTRLTNACSGARRASFLSYLQCYAPRPLMRGVRPQRRRTASHPHHPLTGSMLLNATAEPMSMINRRRFLHDSLLATAGPVAPAGHRRIGCGTSAGRADRVRLACAPGRLLQQGKAGVRGRYRHREDSDGHARRAVNGRVLQSRG